MEVNYYLKEPKKTKTPVLISITWHKHRVKTTFGISIETKSWDGNKQRVKPSYEKAAPINNILQKLTSDLETYYYSFNARKFVPSEDDFKKEIRSCLNRDEPEEPIIQKSFLEHYQDFINETLDGDRLNKEGSPIKRGTYKTYITLQNHLISFINDVYSLSYDVMNKKFFTDFVGYLRKKKGHSHNYIAALTKILKVFLYWSLEHELTTNTFFIRGFEISKIDISSNMIALTEEELKNIENYETLTDCMGHTKDMFLILCYTGLRYSDLFNLKPENIDLKQRIINVNTIKTNENIIIPIGKKLHAILKKYPNKELKPISHQKFNDYVKILCNNCDINEPVIQIKHIGGKRKVEHKLKWELITAHTGRRTFITLALKRGKLPETIMKISGHRDRKSFQKYVKISQNEAVESMRDLF